MHVPWRGFAAVRVPLLVLKQWHTVSVEALLEYKQWHTDYGPPEWIRT